MGVTRFSGPVYGAKATLLSLEVSNVSTATNFTLYSFRIPSYEDWFATELHVCRRSSGGSGWAIKIVDDSTVVSSVTLSTGTNESTWTSITASAGEYEGHQMLHDSSLAIVKDESSAVGVSSAAVIILSGYRRFVSSTRPE
jgi:hypothetical protein